MSLFSKPLVVILALLPVSALAQPVGSPFLFSSPNSTSQQALINSIATTGNMSLFVDPTGNDSNACTGTGVAACLTLQGVENKIPIGVRHSVSVSVAPGTYSAGFTSIGHIPGPNGQISYKCPFGNFSPATGTATGTLSAYTASTSALIGNTLTDGTQTWTVNNLVGQEIEILTGPGAGEVGMIHTNTATSINALGVALPTAPTSSSTYRIRTPQCLISGPAPTSLTQPWFLGAPLTPSIIVSNDPGIQPAGAPGTALNVATTASVVISGFKFVAGASRAIALHRGTLRVIDNQFSGNTSHHVLMLGQSGVNSLDVERNSVFSGSGRFIYIAQGVQGGEVRGLQNEVAGTGIFWVLGGGLGPSTVFSQSNSYTATGSPFISAGSPSYMVSLGDRLAHPQNCATMGGGGDNFGGQFRVPGTLEIQNMVCNDPTGTFFSIANNSILTLDEASVASTGTNANNQSVVIANTGAVYNRAYSGTAFAEPAGGCTYQFNSTPGSCWTDADLAASGYINNGDGARFNYPQVSVLAPIPALYGGSQSTRRALPTCAIKYEGLTVNDVASGGATGVSGHDCECISQGGSNYAWKNKNTGNVGTSTTCPADLPIPVTTAALGLFVDPIGSDSNLCTASGAAACLTWPGVEAKIPVVVNHIVTVTGAAGTYATGFMSTSHSFGPNGQIIYQGTYSVFAPATGTATGTLSSYSAGTVNTWDTLNDTTQTWTVNNLVGQTITTTSGTGSGQTGMVHSNTATAIVLDGHLGVALDSTTHYVINDWATQISGPATPTISQPGFENAPVSGAIVVNNSPGLQSPVDQTRAPVIIQKFKFIAGVTRGVIQINGSLSVQECSFNGNTSHDIISFSMGNNALDVERTSVLNSTGRGIYVTDGAFVRYLVLKNNEIQTTNHIIELQGNVGLLLSLSNSYVGNATSIGWGINAGNQMRSSGDRISGVTNCLQAGAVSPGDFTGGQNWMPTNIIVNALTCNDPTGAFFGVQGPGTSLSMDSLGVGSTGTNAHSQPIVAGASGARYVRVAATNFTSAGGIDYQDNLANVNYTDADLAAGPRYITTPTGEVFQYTIGLSTGVDILRGGTRLPVQTLPTCALKFEGLVVNDVTGGVATGVVSKLCLCVSDGSSVYSWRNVITGTAGTTTTCSP